MHMSTSCTYIVAAASDDGYSIQYFHAGIVNQLPGSAALPHLDSRCTYIGLKSNLGKSMVRPPLACMHAILIELAVHDSGSMVSAC